MLHHCTRVLTAARGITPKPYHGLIFAGLSLIACEEPLTPEQRVAQRANARWQAMIAGEYEKAYGYLSPGFRLKVKDFTYRNRFAGKTTFRSAKISGVVCEQDSCQVTVDTEYTVHAIPPFAMDLDRPGKDNERWVLLDKEWWLVPDK